MERVNQEWVVCAGFLVVCSSGGVGFSFHFPIKTREMKEKCAQIIHEIISRIQIIFDKMSDILQNDAPN